MAVYACTDLHGRLDLFNLIKKYIKPNDTVFFLGDAGDRGPDGWELIKTILRDPQFIYIKGNHEDMLVNAVREYSKNPDTTGKAYRLLERNGGAKTISDWYLEGEDYNIIDEIDKLPTHHIYQNNDGKRIILSHAGLTPWNEINEPTQVAWPFDHNLIWDRDHFWDRWDEEECVPNSIVVHGHTPIQHLAVDLNDRWSTLPATGYWYCDGHKVCIDCQSAFSNIVCLFDLDALEGITFSTDD